MDIGLNALRAPRPNFLAPVMEVEELLRGGGIDSDAREYHLRIADQICNDVVDVHGVGQAQLRYTSGNWYDYESRLMGLHLNRHDFVPTLVIASLVSGESRYRHKLVELFTYWKHNFSVTRLLACDKPIDVAIRLLNWLWCFHFLRPGTDLVDAALLRIVYAQVESIRVQLSPGGNHLVLEALALQVYGTLFADTDYGRKWLDVGSTNLARESERQVAVDGVHTEQSMFYHQLVSTHFLKAQLTASRNGMLVGDGFATRLAGMLEYIHQSMKPDLTHPMLGDGDQMLSDDREHWEAKVLLAARSVLLGRPLYRPFLACLNDTALWFLGLDANAVPSTSVEPASVAYPDTGLVVLRGHGHYLLFDAAPFGDPAYPHHGHADALSIELCLDGRSILMDLGGYAYRDDSLRRYFRGTRGHNTLVLDDTEQSETHGVFGYGRLARTHLVRQVVGGELEEIEGEHYGFRGITHRRQVFWRGTEQPYLVVADHLIGDGRHEVELLWHFSPELSVTVDEGPARVEGAAERVLVWSFGSTVSERVVACGVEGERPQGWVSLSSGSVVPAPVLSVRMHADLPTVVFTVIAPERTGLACEYDAEKGTLQLGGNVGERFVYDREGRVRTETVTPVAPGSGRLCTIT
ncbi:MAG TPA: alginate lyase family protein [Mizugakiibacter sp.]|nr:alginate lyase family protein [Mizugakiibacter sp.]